MARGGAASRQLVGFDPGEEELGAGAGDGHFFVVGHSADDVAFVADLDDGDLIENAGGKEGTLTVSSEIADAGGEEETCGFLLSSRTLLTSFPSGRAEYAA